MFIKETSREKAKELLLMSRKQIKVVVGLLTGHCALKGHLHRMGLYNGDLKCRLCNRETETAQHVLCYCETLDRKRQDIYGQPKLSPEDYITQPTGKLYKLVKRDPAAGMGDCYQNVLSQPLEDDWEEEGERSKRSLYTDNSVLLTGVEKISKRSVEAEDGDMDAAETHAFLPAFARRNFRRSRRSAELEDMEPAENVFLPAFARRLFRGRRGVLQNQDDMETAATNAFLPAFARRRSKRSASPTAEDDLETAPTNAFLPAFARSSSRSKRSADAAKDDMDTAATNAFLPAFARRGLRRSRRRGLRRSRRSANAAEDDMDTAATNAFLPAFARRGLRRSRRSANAAEDDMDTAATNAFLPAFARRGFQEGAGGQLMQQMMICRQLPLTHFFQRLLEGVSEGVEDQLTRKKMIWTLLLLTFSYQLLPLEEFNAMYV
ncbi:hypothetical protein NQ317_012701 [Molorchus minor]|uniref:Reverse transcriptase n=1 Tax=Molorchus minor TaxID=1323400 RepID=A0ABQ9JMS9_9CUCU|nr:hypothetical protein NQ317_012701 [Molorchus minor]